MPEPCRVLLDGTQDEAAQLEPAELAEYVRAKLNLAVDLACQGEQERRSGHRAPAEAYQRQWEEAMAEVNWLLPLVRKSGVSLFATDNHGLCIGITHSRSLPVQAANGANEHQTR